MKFLVWCGSVTICLEGLQLSSFAHDRWWLLWIPLLVFYFFVGLALGGLALAKLVADKVGARGGHVGPGQAPLAPKLDKDK